MPVNKEELVKDLETPEYLGLIKETLAKKEFTVQDKAEHVAYLDRYKSDIMEKELPNKVKSIYDGLDKDIKELFGVDRDPNEKTYDYLKRVGGSKLADSAKKIQELETAIASGKGSEAMAARLEQEQAKYKKTIGELNSKVETLERENRTTGKSAEVKLIFGGIERSFVKTLPPMFVRAKNAALDEAVTLSTYKDGKLYMTNVDGSIRKDNNFAEITVEDFLKAEFKDVIEKQQKQGGAGSPPKNDDGTLVDPSKLTVENFPMQANIKKKGELTDYMLSLGLKQGSKEFIDIWRKYGLPLTEG